MQEKIQLFEKLKDYAVVLFWALLGVTAKISSINKSHKITKVQVLATIATGVFAGFLASLICEYYKVDKNLTWAIISVSALSGENITGWILVNVTGTLTRLYNRIINKK